jgi:DNA polymerase III epsilon subunit-like protein
MGPGLSNRRSLAAETTFVVVDLETTGARARGIEGTPPDAITEIGAVKVRAGAVLGELATLVEPQRQSHRIHSGEPTFSIPARTRRCPT